MKKIDKFIIRLLASFSIAGAFLSIVISLISIFYPEGLTWVSKIPGYANIKLIHDDATWVYPYVKIVFYAISFWGAYELFYFRKRGFWWYFFAQLALLILPYFTWNKTPLLVFISDLPDVYMTVAFVGSYALYYRYFSGAAGSEK